MDKRKYTSINNDDGDLESGKKGRFSIEELSELVSEGDVNKVKQLGGIRGIAGGIQTDLENGLSLNDEKDGFKERKQRYGENRMPKRAQRGFFSFVWEALQDKTLIILSVSAAISIALGLTVEDPRTGWIDGTAILMAVAIVVLVTAGNDFSKEKQFRKLSEARDEKQVTVIRGGEKRSISIYDVLVGDIVELEAGATIPADGLYISGQNVSVDESPMTGESESVKKSDKSPFMLSGCMILEGVCKMVITAVGPHSQKGKISALLGGPSEDTPLTIKLEHLANQIGKFGVMAAGLTLAVLVGQYVYYFVTQHKQWEWSELGILVQYLITAITIIVVAVPEGLPLAVTISLAYSMMKMMKDQNLVRHLEACETMGGATNICSDKTGTLTENRMTVTKVWVAGNELEENNNLNEKISHLFTEGIAVNSSAYIVREPGKAVEFVGNKTEGALLEFANKMGVKYEEVRNKHKNNIAKLYPFSSERKMMSTVVRFDPSMYPEDHSSNPPKYRLYCKGASEIVTGACKYLLQEDGSVVEQDDKMKDQMHQLIDEYASNGLRTIALAFKDIHEDHDWEKDDSDVISDLVFIALAGIKDPVRKEVPDAVKRCQAAGITVRMITGDNILTARHIARECGILTEGGEAIEGPQFRKLPQAELDRLIPKLQVIARSSPTDKYILVHRLRELGEVVAVTGDGVNDAPQLKEADVGFAMGITGTEVAKEASDIVLLDDNFSSIVKAVMWGRNVYDSIRKFVQFQLTVNLVAVAIAFIGAVTKGESPLKPVQLLWVNLIMDTFAALALATERPSEELLKRRPYGRYDNLITRAMWRNIIGQAIFQLGVLLLLLYGIQFIPWFGFSTSPSQFTKADRVLQNTIVFNTFVLCQLFNEINSRKLGNELNVFRGIFTNPVFLGVIAFTIVAQFLIVQFGGSFSSTHPLSMIQWGVCLAIGFITIPYGMLLRLLIRVKEPERVAEAPEAEKRKGKIPVKEEAIVVPPEAPHRAEKTPLLPKDDERALFLWGVAQNVVTEMTVLRALRNSGRRRMSYPSKRTSLTPTPRAAWKKAKHSVART